MVEFCIAVFGGLYLICRYIYETSNQAGFEAHIERSHKLNRNIEADYSCEVEIQNKILNDKCAVDDIKDEIKEVFGTDWNTAVEKYSKDNPYWNRKFSYHSHMIYNPYDVALHLLLAHHGFVIWNNSIGYKIGNPNGSFNNEAIKTLQIVERNIKKTHPDYNYELIFVPEEEFYGKGKCKFRTELWEGSVQWRYRMQDWWIKKYNVPIRRLWN